MQDPAQPVAYEGPQRSRAQSIDTTRRPNRTEGTRAGPRVSTQHPPPRLAPAVGALEDGAAQGGVIVPRLLAGLNFLRAAQSGHEILENHHSGGGRFLHHNPVNILHARPSLHVAQQPAHAGLRDLVPGTQVEPLESGPGSGVRELLAVDSGCDEVAEPHCAVTGHVQARDQGLHLALRHLGPQLPQPRRQLRRRQHAVPVLVEVLEDIAQLPPAGIGHGVR
mmetsp:Transcript_22053/g.53696  ORF Transcript_22053/g.53696 Transcript_22053/m.53696 type:complete len:222 (+) Transcript_22053:299-964(+)